MEQRNGTFHVNASGGRWWPLDPRPEDFSPEDIAHHLSMICRYGGATRFFYSVAEHSEIVSRHVPEEFAFHALLHDAAEAIVGDTIKPIKTLVEWEAVRRVEELNFRAICTRFEIEWTPEIEKVVSDFDRRVVIDECLALIPRGEEYLLSKDIDLTERLYADIAGYSPERAKVAFLLRYQELGGWL